MQLLQKIINGLMLGGILALVAVAFTLTIGMLNFLNFTIPALFMIFGIPHLISLCLAIALVALLHWLLTRTRIGRSLRAIAENPAAATLMGVEVQRIVPVVFAIAGSLSALAGILYAASYGTVTPFMGDAIATDAIAGMVLGGLGNIWGAIAGGLLVGLVKVLAISSFGPEIEKIPVWGLLLVILILRPSGLFGHTKIGKGKFRCRAIWRACWRCWRSTSSSPTRCLFRLRQASSFWALPASFWSAPMLRVP